MTTNTQTAQQVWLDYDLSSHQSVLGEDFIIKWVITSGESSFSGTLDNKQGAFLLPESPAEGATVAFYSVDRPSSVGELLAAGGLSVADNGRVSITRPSILGDDDNNSLYGTENNDRIIGRGGNDYLYGGAGDDRLEGGMGDDTYRYYLGDGDDTIIDTGGQDTLVFEWAIREDDLSVELSGNDLIITIDDGNDDGQITIEGWVVDADKRIETIEFGHNKIANLGELLSSTEGVDTLTWTYSVFSIDGGGGNDTLIGGTFDDHLEGGTGNDRLEGGGGDDTYYYYLGDGDDTIVDTGGQDTLVFEWDIKEDDLSVELSGNDLIITIDDGNDDGQITIEGWVVDADKRIETIEFGHNKIANLGELLSSTEGVDTLTWTYSVFSIDGGGGNDTITGGEFDDHLEGGTGNDRLEGGGGDDTYYYDLGDGDDTIVDTGGQDTVVFGRYITKDNLSVELSGNDLIITISDGDEATEDNTITINDWNVADNRIETIELSDGTCFGQDYILAQIALSEEAATEETVVPVPVSPPPPVVDEDTATEETNVPIPALIPLPALIPFKIQRYRDDGTLSTDDADNYVIDTSTSTPTVTIYLPENRSNTDLGLNLVKFVHSDPNVQVHVGSTSSDFFPKANILAYRGEAQNYEDLSGTPPSFDLAVFLYNERTGAFEVMGFQVVIEVTDVDEKPTGVDVTYSVPEAGATDDDDQYVRETNGDYTIKEGTYANGLKLADITIQDDALGENAFTNFPPESKFIYKNINGNTAELWLKDGATLDFEGQSDKTIMATVEVTGSGEGGNPTARPEAGDDEDTATEETDVPIPALIPLKVQRYRDDGTLSTDDADNYVIDTSTSTPTVTIYLPENRSNSDGGVNLAKFVHSDPNVQVIMGSTSFDFFPKANILAYGGEAQNYEDLSGTPPLFDLYVYLYNERTGAFEGNKFRVIIQVSDVDEKPTGIDVTYSVPEAGDDEDTATEETVVPVPVSTPSVVDEEAATEETGVPIPALALSVVDEDADTAEVAGFFSTISEEMPYYAGNDDYNMLSVDGVVEVAEDVNVGAIYDGYAGDDRITVEDGTNFIAGGEDNDTITLGRGVDTVVYWFESLGGGRTKATDGQDSIHKFALGVDQLIFTDIGRENPITSLREFLETVTIDTQVSEGVITGVEFGFTHSAVVTGVAAKTVSIEFTEETKPEYGDGVLSVDEIIQAFGVDKFIVVDLDTYMEGLSSAFSQVQLETVAVSEESSIELSSDRTDETVDDISPAPVEVVDIL
jgi:Ca2+-binding RTX toxin-like protein